MTLDAHPVELARRAVTPTEPTERLQAIAALRYTLEELEADVVTEAVRGGMSWARVARALGITRQSAHRRYAKHVADPAAAVPRRRPNGIPADEQVVVTAQARGVVRAARAAARALGHAEVDSSHLLLGLLAEQRGAASQALNEIGAEFDAARDAIDDTLALPRRRGRGRGRSRIPISSATRAVLEQSLREVQRLGHRQLGAEHLLLAVLHDEEGGAVRVLARLGITPEDLERCLGKVLKEAPFLGSA
jgi:Clp amino terminal domain, pathogenicity island component